MKLTDPVTRKVPLRCAVAGATPGVPHVVAAWQSVHGAFPPLVVVVRCAWCVRPVALPTLVMSVWHMMHAVVFVVVLPFHEKSIPAVFVVALLLWQLVVAQVPPPATAQTPLSDVFGSHIV